MGPPDAERRPPARDAATHEINQQTKPTPTDRQPVVVEAGTAAMAAVNITERRVTADVQVPDARAAGLVRRVVPRRGRETRDEFRFVVFASHLRRLVDALQAAGYPVEVTR
ncbi:MAG TPA: hypothetical protein VM367_10525 [Pseudonocardia sp.]|jgi:hypothetical protein|nr:hypothetical protein [Pseudonocardia sp.]